MSAGGLQKYFKKCFKNASVEYFTVHFTELITYYSKKIPLSYGTLFFQSITHMPLPPPTGSPNLS